MAAIIVVDDDEIVARMASDVLVEAGHACGWVTGVADAKALLKWRRPDLVLLDHDMPSVTGSEFLRELRNSENHYDLPVIMFTRMSGEGDEDAARFNGAQDYIRKPFNPQSLLWKVEKQLLARRQREKHRNLRRQLEISAGRLEEGAALRRAI